jgi:hypothetical protein
MVEIDSTFKFDKGREYYETENAWAKVRIQKDPRKGDFYIDVLIGSRGEKKPHAHFGINSDQSIRFFEPRDVLNSISRKVVSKNLGVIEDKTVNLKSETGTKKFTFNVNIDEPKRTIKVLFNDAELTPNI